MNSLLGGDCNYGRCKCKNKRGTRCGNCSQEGTLFCHLHQWCSDPANAGLERNGWIAPYTPMTEARRYADFYQRQQNAPRNVYFQQPLTQESSPMLRASSLAAQTLQQPIEKVVNAVSNISDFYVPPPISDTIETVKPISRLGNILKEGGTCDTIIIRYFPRQLYTSLQVKRIYDEDAALSEYSLEDVMICLKKNKKIGNSSAYLDAIGLKRGGSAPAAAINNLTETAARVIAQPLIDLARGAIAPSAPPAPSTEIPAASAPYAPRAPSLTSTLNSAFTLPVPNAGKILEDIATLPSAAAAVAEAVVTAPEAVVTAPPPALPVLVETAPPPDAPNATEGNPFNIMRSMLFLGSFFPPPQDNTVPFIYDPSFGNQSAKPPQIPDGFMWDYTNNKLVPDPGAFWDSRRFG